MYKLYTTLGTEIFGLIIMHSTFTFDQTFTSMDDEDNI